RTFGGGGMGGASYHSDVHALWVDPKNPEYVVLGTDGGVYISYNRGTTWRAVLGIPVGQFYHVTYDMQWPYHVYGGLQDNGTWRAPSRHSGGIPNRLWESLNGGDGFWAFPDPKDEDLVYTEYQGGNISRVRMSTGESKDIKPTTGPGDPKLRFNWNAPMHVGASGALYVGSQFLYRSRDQGDTWEKLGGDLTTNDPLKQQQDKSGGLSVDNSSAENHCTVYAIGESPKDPAVVWVGTDDGNIQLTRDGGRIWTNVTANLPGLAKYTWISSVNPSTFDAATCFVTADGHFLNDMRPHVYVTHDYGHTWKSLATDALRGHAHVVKQDLVNPELLFVGTEWGLFTSLDGGQQWAQIKAGIPDVAVRDLAIHPREGDLLVATHGRGIFILDDLTPLRKLTRDVLASDGAFLPSRASVLMIPSNEQRFSGDADYSGESLAENAFITYYLKKRHVIGDLKLEIFDPSGKLLSTINGGRRRGINRVDWPMRLKGPKLAPAANLVPNSFAFVGPRAKAGEYTVKLTRNKDVYTSTIALVSDPRSTHTTADRAAQSELVLDLYDRVMTLTYTVESAATVGESALANAKVLKQGEPLRTRLEVFAADIDRWRGTMVAIREGGRLTGEEQLREKLGDLYGKVNGYDGKPTASQTQLRGVLLTQLTAGQSAIDAMLAKRLPSLNSALVSHKLAPLKRPSRTEWDAAQKDK
ncbi:MAG: glycosyl hydrolase, partial [Candidatus Eisenbacteria bacterium]